MDMPMPSMVPGAAYVPVSGAGLDLTNDTVASDYLANILFDLPFDPENKARTRDFWLGIIAVLFVAAVARVTQWTILKLRFVLIILMS
jgi:hypothetical protein